jgi:signal transduction histidine kinase
MHIRSPTFERLRDLLRPAAPDPAEQLFRLKAVERDIILPIKLLYISFLLYFFYFGPWYGGESGTASEIVESLTEQFFRIYLALNVAVAIFLLKSRRLPLVLGQRVVFVMSFVDTLFLAALTLVTGGFDSTLYWLFPGLIIRNAVSHPVARLQIILNTSVVLSFVIAGILDVVATNYEGTLVNEIGRDNFSVENPAEPFLLRLFVLILLTASCYALQVLFEKARQTSEETREFITRQEQLRAAGRVAAEVAHQIKNPLGIINNAAFALQRSVAAGKPVPLQQIEIIREEVERSDRIVTELMGYAQLAEGTVERLNVISELNRAIGQVFPAAVYRGIQVRTDYDDPLPPLLMQRKHFSEIIVNILQNARDVLPGGGHIDVQAEAQDGTVRVTIADDGPGIPPERTEKIFEPYFSTKPQGTGLGLAIVRHNAEIYSGHVRVESELGHGTRFVLEFPTRTLMKLQK